MADGRSYRSPWEAHNLAYPAAYNQLGAYSRVCSQLGVYSPVCSQLGVYSRVYSPDHNPAGSLSVARSLLAVCSPGSKFCQVRVDTGRVWAGQGRERRDQV